MIPHMVREEAHPPQNAAQKAGAQNAPSLEPASGAKPCGRSPLAQLLHALNQPLTGLQCSMEVALASPRTLEQYVHGLREGLVLTERMRALVEAIREVADVEAGEKPEQETTELKSLLQETVDDLEPVAAAREVRLTLDGSSPSSFSSSCSSSSSGLTVSMERSRLAMLMFRILDSALSLSAWGTALRIDTGTGSRPDQVWMRVRWHAGASRSACSRPELGFLVVQAGLERAGAEWERERTEDLETVTIGWKGVSASTGNAWPVRKSAPEA